MKQFQDEQYKETLNELAKSQPKQGQSIEQYVDEIRYNHYQYSKVLEDQGVTLKKLGTLSTKQAKTVRKCVENMVNYVSINFNHKKKVSEQSYLSFCTLTLSNPQKHNDTFIRKHLVRFIELMRKSKSVRFYMWRAEAQKNGNIHFHVLFDKFIHHEYIRLHWNNQQLKMGYIKEGENPPSTEIKSLKNKRDVSSYITKYLTKIEEDKRPIIGAIWGASNELKKIDYPTVYNGDAFYDMCKLLDYDTFKQLDIPSDYIKVWIGKVFQKLRNEAYSCWQAVRLYYKSTVDKYLELAKEKAEEIRTSVKKVVPEISVNTIGLQTEMRFSHIANALYMD
ncbi:hypothetical protein GWK08_08825 [Leptobacterium flavescens]|uniref:Replication-associated protein ORF2/G2P domain-containing protein n=1 Tax=Leptobacterium flavescens TaxID=472055 RepID=A0A6P0UKP4_9FLAO|nr:hypothetical protein [Leptobacterium flavescens]NER13537.1 hypothetical protein [Leptobacterium flavescens]